MLQDDIKLEIKEILREQDLLDPKEALRRFPEYDAWDIRKLVAEVRRERARATIDVSLQPTISRKVHTFDLPPHMAIGLDAGFFRPVQIQFNYATKQKPLFPKAVREVVLIVSDFHFPIHDRDFVDVLIQIASALDIDRIIINGDLFDITSLSRHVSDRERPVRWVDERAEALREVVYLRAMLPGVPFEFIPGNHDIRPLKWIDEKAIPLQGMFSLEHLLGIDDPKLGIEMISEGRIILSDDLMVKHGTRVSKHAGESVKKEMEEAQMGVIMGHIHRAAIVHQRKARQAISNTAPLVGVELGCGCSLNPTYLPKEDTANWQHAFAIVSIDDDGYAEPELVRVHQGRALFRGMRFESRLLKDAP